MQQDKHVLSPEDREELVSRLRDYTNYCDVFGYALALTKTERFTNDSARWSSTLYNPVQKYRKNIPQLSHVYFDTRPPLITSDEIYQFLSWLRMSGFAYGLSPQENVLVVEQRAKERLLEIEKKRLGQYEPYIKEMAELIDEELPLSKVTLQQKLHCFLL